MTKLLLSGAVLVCLAASGAASAQLAFTKVQVGDRIRKVEDGVDEFRKWSEKRAEQGKDQAQTAKESGRARGNLEQVAAHGRLGSDPPHEGMLAFQPRIQSLVHGVHDQPEAVLGAVAHRLPDHGMGPEANGGQADHREEEERQRPGLVTQTHGQMIYPLS